MSVGRITRPHGLKGELRVQSFLSDRSLLKDIPVFYLGREESAESLRPTGVREAPGGRDLLFRFEGVEDLEAAEELRGRVLYAELADFPEPEEGEYYYFQLEGLLVKDEKGERLGRVKGVMPVGPYDLLEVETENRKTFYLPMVEGIVLEINLSEGYILVNPTPGLIESQL
ncbi:ribosome maturation factor RimM [Thermosulfurimonas sp. F29]|uniref:ribosome maturation factor RimM n=1 Tax=Thermosulfurimonas sp. F29 TaxID=2867247 RepID=UPI001C83F1DA|nr:ribosome maturation factor RimM [Thermosulfurimonas sp. F29]MBX6422361.1 ribosome maturation factor RimM [Thermosulfurimonas sp. F29]